MTPTQSQLWQFLGLPHWQCAHPERLPLAPFAPAEVLIVVKTTADIKQLFSGHFVGDLCLALSLDESQVRVISQADWLRSDRTASRLLLGLNLSCELTAFDWHAEFPLTSAQKRTLWSCLCRCYLEH